MRCPLFSEFDGGDRFRFLGDVYLKKEWMGSGGYGVVHRFKGNQTEREVIVKSDLPSATRDGVKLYTKPSTLKREAYWYNKIYGLGVFSGDICRKTKGSYLLAHYIQGKTLRCMELYTS